MSSEPSPKFDQFDQIITHAGLDRLCFERQGHLVTSLNDDIALLKNQYDSLVHCMFELGETSELTAEDAKMIERAFGDKKFFYPENLPPQSQILVMGGEILLLHSQQQTNRESFSREFSVQGVYRGITMIDTPAAQKDSAPKFYKNFQPAVLMSGIVVEHPDKKPHYFPNGWAVASIITPGREVMKIIDQASSPER